MRRNLLVIFDRVSFCKTFLFWISLQKLKRLTPDLIYFHGCEMAEKVAIIFPISFHLAVFDWPGISRTHKVIWSAKRDGRKSFKLNSFIFCPLPVAQCASMANSLLLRVWVCIHKCPRKVRYAGQKKKKPWAILYGKSFVFQYNTATRFPKPQNPWNSVFELH